MKNRQSNRQISLKVSVIDLGFNSLKLVCYEVRQDNSFIAYDQESVPARLGEGLSQTGFLGAEPMRRAIEGLKFFREINELYGIRHCLPVATSAVREAANKEQFLNQVLEETGFKFRTLSGKEEALYSYFGASMALGESGILFFDIGGGSLEFVYSNGSRVKKIFSFPLGGLRLTQLYADEDGTFKNKSYWRMKKRIMDLLPTKQELLLSEDTVLAGVGGNLRALARLDQALKDYPFNKIHNYTIKRQSVETMCGDLSSMTRREIAEIQAIGRDRATTIVAGSLVIECIMKKLGFQRLTVSTHGLRDGVLASFLQDPLSYHKGKIGNSFQSETKSIRDKMFEQSIGNFLKVLESYDLVDDRENRIVLFALNWLVNNEALSFRPDPLFALMMDEDSRLSHRDQLIASLAVVELRKARTAQWLFSRYSSLLKTKSDESIERIASISRFLEIIVRTGSKVRISFAENGARIMMSVSPPKQPTQQKFPQKMLHESVNELGRKLDRFIEYKIKSNPLVLDSERNDQIAQETVENLENKEPYRE
jgi:exopolyphosphatase / guanosine-5'-triphosphate,3'-diphosphate pyrophosphatase